MCVPLPCWGYVHIGFRILLLLDEGQMAAVSVRFACPFCPKVVGFIVFGRAYCPIYIRCAIVLVGISMAHVSLYPCFICLCCAACWVFFFSRIAIG